MSARHEATARRLTIDEIKAISADLAVSLGKAFAEAFTEQTDAFSLATFCQRHGISLQMFYKLVQQGIAPDTFNVGTRVLVSKEAAAKWRAERQAATRSREIANAE